ncbi:Mitogen-activated protein kinase kinase kinase 12 [Taenia crassiceps]|uniref:Mitogen-activated protein kinase kinase kinase 12 n=1 Tax=Taenia crassiceps TaxID=6207 RepID=A0ABR4Q8I1_9CEST
MACNTTYQSKVPDASKYAGKQVSCAKPLSSASSRSSSGVSFEDTVSDISHFTNNPKKFPGEACSELSYTHSSSSGFITTRDDGITSSLHSTLTDPQTFPWKNEPIASVFRDASKTELLQPLPSQVPLRKSFLPYTESSQYDDDEEEEENAMSRSQNHFSTVHFKPMVSRQPKVIATISDRPFAGCGNISRLASPPPLEPKLDEQLTLSVSNFLLSLGESSPQHISSKCSTVASVEKRNHHENTGCFWAFLRLFLKDENSAFCQAVEEPQWEWPPSEILDLQYVGSGAQGSVYKATLRGRVIAVKKVSKQSETEIRHLRGLCHPNVVQFLGVSIDGPWYSILMEYCPNGTFFELLHNNPPVNIDNIIDWTQQIAQGMNYLHSHKVVHRDLKSPNILISEDGQLKISDFGVSKEFTENSTKMSFAGTVAWMAPEIMRGEPCSFKVDVWSFGVIVWEILTCEVPFNGVDCGAIIYGIASNLFSLPIPTACPTEFRVLMKRCWSPRPRNRPSFPQILSQLELACTELLQWKDENFTNLRELWQEEIHLQLMDLLKEGSRAPKLEISLMRQRRQELKDAQSIRQNYEEKLHRVNQLCSHLKALTEELEREQQKVTQERNRYRRLIYERSRSNTPFSVENFTKKLPPVGSSQRSQSKDRRNRGTEAKFTCKNCGTVNTSSLSAGNSPSRPKVDAQPPRWGSKQSTSGHNPRWLRIWYAATRSKLLENASLMKVKLRRFASFDDIHTDPQEKKSGACCKSINVPPHPPPLPPSKEMDQTNMLSQARQLDSEAEEQVDVETSSNSGWKEVGIQNDPEAAVSISRFPASRDILCQHVQDQPGSPKLRRSSWSSGNPTPDTSQPLTSIDTHNSPELKNLRLSMFFEKQQHLNKCQRSFSVSSSLSSESGGFNGSKATVIFQHLNSRPQSGDTCHTKRSKSLLPTHGVSIERLHRADDGGIKMELPCPPCLPSAQGPTLSVSLRSSPRLRQQPGRRHCRPPPSPLSSNRLPALLPPPTSPAAASIKLAPPSTVSPVSRSAALGLSVDTTTVNSSVSTSLSITTSQMRRSIENLAMELTDHIADSLSEKERRVDVIERQLLKAACDRQWCLPVHSVALVDGGGDDNRALGKAKADCGVAAASSGLCVGGGDLFGLEKPWLSAADLNCKANGASMDASSILDTESIPTDSDTDVH